MVGGGSVVSEARLDEEGLFSVIDQARHEGVSVFTATRDIANLIETITSEGVSVVFTDVGTPQSVARTVADEGGAEIIELSVAQLPEDGTCRALMLELAQTIADAFAE